MSGGTAASAFGAMVAAALATYLWRAAGVALAERIDLNSPWLRWFACVAYALVAGLVARLVLRPSGPLVGVALAPRLAAAAIGVAAFAASGRNLLAGVAASATALAVLVLVAG